MPAVRRPQNQLKRVCFTLNNYSDEDERRIQESTGLYLYAIYGRETAPTTGTRHLQGFINFKSKREFSVVKQLCGESSHIERANGDDLANQEYCRKDGDFWEFGTPSRQGQRCDLEKCVETIKGGAGLYDIVEKHMSTFIRYPRGIERALTIINGGRPGGGRDFKTE